MNIISAQQTQKVDNIDHDFDAAILAGLNRRDPSVMGEVYRLYGRRVYALVYRIVRNPAEAEEISQEAFLLVWTRSHLIDPSCHRIGPWILTVARNRAIDHIRVAAILYEWLDYPHMDRFESTELFHGEVPLYGDGHCLEQRIAELSKDQKRVIELAFFEGLTHVEMSHRLGKPLGTVKTWARTALSSLRQNIQRE